MVIETLQGKREIPKQDIHIDADFDEAKKLMTLKVYIPNPDQAAPPMEITLIIDVSPTLKDLKTLKSNQGATGGNPDDGDEVDMKDVIRDVVKTVLKVIKAKDQAAIVNYNGEIIVCDFNEENQEKE